MIDDEIQLQDHSEPTFDELLECLRTQPNGASIRRFCKLYLEQQLSRGFFKSLKGFEHLACFEGQVAVEMTETPDDENPDRAPAIFIRNASIGIGQSGVDNSAANSESFSYEVRSTQNVITITLIFVFKNHNDAFDMAEAVSLAVLANSRLFSFKSKLTEFYAETIQYEGKKQESPEKQFKVAMPLKFHYNAAVRSFTEAHRLRTVQDETIIQQS